MKRGQPLPEAETIEAPAKASPGHARNRLLGPEAGAKHGWVNRGEHPLTWAYAKGQLTGGSGRYSPRDRFQAGDEYRQLFEAMHRTGRDSTDLDVVRGGGSGDGITRVRADAIRKIAAIEHHLAARDRQIIRHVCGEAWKPVDAVRDACGPDYVDATLPRLREALDALIEAFKGASAAKWRAG